MKTLTLLPLAALLPFALLSNCGSSSACPGVSSLDDQLTSTCGEPAASADAGVAGCTPHAGTICTVVGTGIAGIGTNGVRGTMSETYLPQDVTMAPDGQDAYFLDWNNHVVRVLHHADQTVETVVGTGELSDAVEPDSAPSTTPSPAIEARLNHPTGVIFNPEGQMIVSAWHNSKLMLVSNPADPTMSTIIDLCGNGTRSYSGDGVQPSTTVPNPALAASLNLPVQTALAPDGSLWLSDQANQRIRRVDSNNVITTVVGTGTAGYTGDNGPAAMATIRSPVGQAAAPAGRIVFDSAGSLYLADTGNNAIRKVSSVGTGASAVWMITTVAGTGMAGYSGDGGPATMAEINGPADVAVGPDGTLYIADTQNSCIRSVTADGNIHTVAGVCGTNGFTGDGGPPATAQMNRPYGIDVDASHRIWIADTYNQRIRVVTLQ